MYGHCGQYSIQNFETAEWGYGGSASAGASAGHGHQQIGERNMNMLLNENLVHLDPEDLRRRRSRLLSAYRKLRLRMVDEGCDLPPDMQQRLFAKAGKLDNLDLDDERGQKAVERLLPELDDTMTLILERMAASPVNKRKRSGPDSPSGHHLEPPTDEPSKAPVLADTAERKRAWQAMSDGEVEVLTAVDTTVKFGVNNVANAGSCIASSEAAGESEEDSPARGAGHKRRKRGWCPVQDPGKQHFT